MSKVTELQTMNLQLLALVEGLRFPDVDAETLAADLRTVQTEAARVENLRVQLDDARGKLDDAEKRLDERQHRALAYLRIFAEGNAELSAQLAALDGDRPVVVAPRKRGRPRKSEVLELTAFGEPEATA